MYNKNRVCSLLSDAFYKQLKAINEEYFHFEYQKYN
jgi:hypothetical protein